MTVFLILFGTLAVEAQDWAPLHNLLIKYYGYQRAGSKTIDTHNPFYKTSPYPHSQDNQGGTDLSGGWYDAGDFVKFGLPFGYSVYTLLKGYDVFPHAYDDLDSWDYKGVKDGIPDVLGEAKLATDYLLKAVISDNMVVTDVGNGATDHQQLNESGYANSQRTSPRGATVSTGADIAGLDAAALALMAKLYKPYDAVYAAACLAKAKSAFTFGLAHQSLSQEQDNGSYYSTKTFVDKMACGAVELYRASGDSSFLVQARSFQSKVASHFFVLGYANVGDLSAFELARLGYDAYQSTWLTDVDLTLSRVVTISSASELIKGAFIRSDWGNAGHAAAAAFSAALAFQITGSNLYRDFAIEQMKWVSGNAPYKQSYVVGYLNGPTNPHHRNDVALGGSTGVRAKGGIVSGPTPVGTYNDGHPEATGWSFNGSDASNYKNNEMALDYNAAAVGAVAFIRDYLNPPAGQVRISEALKATPDNVDFNSQTSAITFTFETPAAWKLVLTGRLSKAKKTFTGTTAANSVKWAGESDEGTFSAGETVDMQLTDPIIAPYHVSRAKATLFITAAKKAPFLPTDVNVDDFNDGDSLNAIAGHWSVFTDKESGGTSYANPPGFAAAVTTGGADSTKGVSVRLVATAGAPNPVVGIRSTFNAAGSAVDLGPAKSLVFDVRSTSGSSFWVELEQSDITDGAFYGFKVQVASDSWNRIRIPLSSFSQPAWKVAAKPINLGSNKSLRFAYHGVGTVRFDLDNVRMEGLKVGGAAVRTKATGGLPHAVSHLRVLASGIDYRFLPPDPAVRAWKVCILDVTGKSLLEKRLDLEKATSGAEISLSAAMGPGIYFLSHTPDDGSTHAGKGSRDIFVVE